MTIFGCRLDRLAGLRGLILKSCDSQAEAYLAEYYRVILGRRWYSPVVSALGRQMQVGCCEFEAGLVCLVSSS